MSTYAEALAAHLRDNNLTDAEFATAVETTQASINRYRNGKRFPDADVARAIDAATDGAVPFSAWQAEYLGKAGITGAAA